LGSARHDLQVDEDGNAVGRGVEPSAHAIHLGSSWGDFSVGDRVYGWWWGLLWPCCNSSQKHGGTNPHVALDCLQKEDPRISTSTGHS
jgi:hypothetical protein